MAPCPECLPDVEGFVLAGGLSTRMGRDKALVEFAGKPLVWWAVEVLRTVGQTVRIAGAHTDLTAFAPVVPDEAAGSGPLAGVCSALKTAAAEWAVFMPIDLPLIPASLLRYLIHHARVSGVPVTLASLNGFAQTFPAVVRHDALQVLSAELQAKRLGAFAAFSKAGVHVVPVENVVQAGHVCDKRGMLPYRWFSNVNTPDELERVAAHLVS